MSDSPSYITPDEFLGQLDDSIKSQLSDFAGSGDDDVLTEVLFVASRRMDGWLASRYVTPITGALSLEILRSYIGPIAIKVLVERKMVARLDDNTEYDAAREWLKAVGLSKGGALPDAALIPVPTTVPAALKALYGSECPVFEDDAGKGV